MNDKKENASAEKIEQKDATQGPTKEQAIDEQWCPMIYRLIPKIIGEISPIAKTRKNQAQGYHFRGVDDIYEALNGLLSKHGVTILPVLDTIEEATWQNNKGNQVFRVKCIFNYRFYAPDGSTLTARVPSEAIDTGDKATPKALSMAYKYMAFQVFCIPLDERLDTEEQTHEIAGRPEQPEANGEAVNRLTKAVGSKRSDTAKPGPEQIERIARLENFFKANPTQATWYLSGKHFKNPDMSGELIPWIGEGEDCHMLSDEKIRFITSTEDMLMKWCSTCIKKYAEHFRSEAEKVK